MAPSVLGWGSRWILQKPWKCRAVYGWFRGMRAPDWAAAPGRALGPGQHPATRGAAHTLASSAPRPAWGAAPPGVWLSPPEQVGVSAASPRPHPRPLLRGIPPPARRSPRLRPGLLPFTLDPQPRRCGPGSRPQRVPAPRPGTRSPGCHAFWPVCRCCVCPLPPQAVRAVRRAGDTLPRPRAGAVRPSPHRQVVTPANQPVTRWRDHLPLGLPASWPEEPEVMWIGRQAQLLGVPGWGALPPSLGSSEQG